AAKIQGANVSSSVPSEGQVLMYSSLNNRWQPGNVSGGGSGAISSVFGRTGAIVAQSGDYSFSQITGTAALSQLPSGTDAGKLQGRDLATAAPSDGQALLWNASVNQWAPGTVSNSGSGLPSFTGTSNMVLASNGTSAEWRSLGGDISGPPQAATVLR